MSNPDEALSDATASLVGCLLHTLDHLEVVARRLHPPEFAQLVASLDPDCAALGTALGEFQAIVWPEQLTGFRDQVVSAGQAALLSCSGLLEAGRSPDGRRLAFQALRHAARATEALYPVAASLPTVSRWFLDPDRRQDVALLSTLDNPGPDTGVFHIENDTRVRGGYSVYVPESYDGSSPLPLVAALHGGAGHGRLFLWSWLREARTRGAILVAPTATGDTWSIMEPEIDSAHLAHILEVVQRRWRVDPTRRLLTGMSDGGTFTLVSGLQDDSPFTHLAPVAASFHPLLLALTEPERVRGLPVYLIHGVLDWMFPVTMARTANQALRAAGADVTYREIADLSHVYPRDENAAMLDWFLGPNA